MFRFRFSALAKVADALARVLEPPTRQTPSQWAAANLIVPDGPCAGDRWSAELTPYILEPLDNFGPESGVNEQAVMKSAQTGFTTLAIAAVGHSIDADPCRMMVLQPTDAALSDFNREKLQVAIDNSPALKRKVAPQIAKSGKGSTSYAKAYPGGSLTLAIASSAADLRSKTIRKMIRDEIDQYPLNIGKQGNPIKLSDGRLMSFLASGDWRKLDISTPTIKGVSNIEKRYSAGDKRRWHIKCPGCSDEFVFEWGQGFRFDRTWPHKAHYIAQCCGTVIEAHEKIGLVRAGRWIATDPGPGKFPSYHFDTLSSPFVPWDDVAKAFLAAGDDPEDLKAFWNVWLGLPYEVKGDAPDHEMLAARREEGLERGRIPAGGTVLVGTADVQMRGIWWLVLAMGPRRESWVVDCGYIEGDTSSPDGEAFAKLRAEVLDRAWPDAWGRVREFDAFGIDSGYQSQAVYAWVRRVQRLNRTGHHMVFALKGEDGWGKPPISAAPKLVDIDLGGRKVKQGCKLWQVGTWPLKGAFYEDLRKTRGETGVPEGYQHFGTWLDSGFFKQITAEYLKDEVVKGRPRKIWSLNSSSKDNHWLDCEVYAGALASHLGLGRMTSDEWAALEAERGAPPAEAPSLFSVVSNAELASRAADAAKAVQPSLDLVAPPAAPPRPLAASPSWMRPREGGWMGRQ